MFDFLPQCCNIFCEQFVPFSRGFGITHEVVRESTSQTVFIWHVLYYWLVKMKCQKAFAKNTAEKKGFVAISKSKFWLSLYKVLKDWLHKPLRGSHFIYFIYTHAISCSHDWLCNILYFLEICSHTNTYHRQKNTNEIKKAKNQNEIK